MRGSRAFWRVFGTSSMHCQWSCQKSLWVQPYTWKRDGKTFEHPMQSKRVQNKSQRQTKGRANSLQNSNIEVLSNFSNKLPNLLFAKPGTAAQEFGHLHGIISHYSFVDQVLDPSRGLPAKHETKGAPSIQSTCTHDHGIGSRLFWLTKTRQASPNDSTHYKRNMITMVIRKENPNSHHTQAKQILSQHYIFLQLKSIQCAVTRAPTSRLALLNNMVWHNLKFQNKPSP